VELDIRIPSSRKSIALQDDKTGNEISCSSSTDKPGESLSKTLERRCLSRNRETQLKPVTDSSVPLDIQTAEV
jgi:hypothetical protein